MMCFVTVLLSPHVSTGTWSQSAFSPAPRASLTLYGAQRPHLRPFPQAQEDPILVSVHAQSRQKIISQASRSSFALLGFAASRISLMGEGCQKLRRLRHCAEVIRKSNGPSISPSAHSITYRFSYCQEWDIFSDSFGSSLCR